MEPIYVYEPRPLTEHERAKAEAWRKTAGRGREVIIIPFPLRLERTDAPEGEEN